MFITITVSKRQALAIIDALRSTKGDTPAPPRDRLLADRIRAFLDKGKPTAATEAKERTPKSPILSRYDSAVKTCPTCFRVVDIARRVCPACDHIFYPKRGKE